MNGGRLSFDRPVLFHVHGISKHDFSSLLPEELESVQKQAEARNIDVVPTIFLRKDWLAPCETLLGCYDQTAEQLPNILGFAIEGPLLGPSGGTPQSASWMPSAAEWIRIAALGRSGLRYIVLAPDAMEPEDAIAPGFRLIDLIEALSESGVRIALGHFRGPTLHAVLTGPGGSLTPFRRRMGLRGSTYSLTIYTTTCHATLFTHGGASRGPVGTGSSRSFLTHRGLPATWQSFSGLCPRLCSRLPATDGFCPV